VDTSGKSHRFEKFRKALGSSSSCWLPMARSIPVQ